MIFRHSGTRSGTAPLISIIRRNVGVVGSTSTWYCVQVRSTDSTVLSSGAITVPRLNSVWSSVLIPPMWSKWVLSTRTLLPLLRLRRIAQLAMRGKAASHALLGTSGVGESQRVCEETSWRRSGSIPTRRVPSAADRQRLPVRRR